MSTKTLEQSAVEACQAYAMLRSEIDAMTRKIGDHSMDCIVAASRSEYDLNTEAEHLTEFFGIRNEALGRGNNPEMAYSEDELKEACPHCYAAFQVIKQRKVARRRLAHVKRQITVIGKKGH